MYADYPLDPQYKRCSFSRCVNLLWLDRALAYERTTYRDLHSWHGTLLRAKRDGSGLLYRRNRYYDPATGRFTQEDPIGLAGGLNLYGFASGDPVNHSDPFGLCDTLCYDGTNLTLTRDDGTVLWSGPAYSGRGGSRAEDQDQVNKGPIPEGTYILDASEISHVTGVRAWVRNLLGDWGNYRAPLHPAPGTDTHGRDGFFLHGGRTPGSAGCIDVCRGESSLFPILQQEAKSVVVVVKYPSPSTQTAPPRPAVPARNPMICGGFCE